MDATTRQDGKVGSPGPSGAGREWVRQGIHVLSGAGAVLCRWVDPRVIALGTFALIPVVLLIRHNPFSIWTFRPGESRVSGAVHYLAGVGIALLLYPAPVAAGAWAILAAGDGVSSVVGGLWGRRALPWNRKKSGAGLASFIAASLPAAYFCVWWASSAGHRWEFLVTALLGSVAGAFVESLPIPSRLNDNLTIPVGSGAAMGLVWLFL